MHARLTAGGAELRMLDVMRRLDGVKHRCDVCSLSGRPEPLDTEVERLGGRVRRIRCRSLGFSRRFCDLPRRRRYDVVQSQVLNFSGVILQLAVRCGIPVRIVQFHNTDDDGRRSTLSRRTAEIASLLDGFPWPTEPSRCLKRRLWINSGRPKPIGGNRQ